LTKGLEIIQANGVPREVKHSSRNDITPDEVESQHAQIYSPEKIKFLRIKQRTGMAVGKNKAISINPSRALWRIGHKFTPQ